MDFGPRDMDPDEDDILPDTNIDRERTLTGRWAIGLFVLSAAFMTVAFVTPNWIEGDPRFYGTKVERVGLWVHCFRSLPDFNDLKHQRFYAGCRWIFNPFTEGYDEIRSYLAPRKNKSNSFKMVKMSNFVFQFQRFLSPLSSSILCLLSPCSSPSFSWSCTYSAWMSITVSTFLDGRESI